jgi:HSP20 family protein
MMWAPQVDIVEMDDAYHLHLDLPGLAKKDVRVELHDGRLMISGERAETRETEGETVHRIERSSGRFYRAFSLPQVTDEADVRASMKNGVLTIRVAKPAESTPRRIDVA